MLILRYFVSSVLVLKQNNIVAKKKNKEDNSMKSLQMNIAGMIIHGCTHITTVHNYHDHFRMSSSTS
jgi:aspartate/glutamate racemase